MKKKESTKAIMKRYTPEEAKDKILQFFTSDGVDVNRTLKKLGDDYLPKLLHGNAKEKKEAGKIFNDNDKMTEIMMALESDTHWGLMSAFGSQYRGMANELCSQVIKEYTCTTHAEIMLAEVIVNAFIRTVDASRELTEARVAAGGSITENRTKYIAVLSKQHDRANRQFLNSLMILKQLKAPTIEMNIRTKNTFVAQNQQINASGPLQATNPENNETK